MYYVTDSTKGGNVRQINEEHKISLQEMRIHRQFWRQEEDLPQFDTIISVNWLHTAHLRFETESAICAAQKQALETGGMRARIHGDVSSVLCRLRKEQQDTVDHIVAGCKMLCGNIYLHRHNLICTYIHWAIMKDLGCIVPETWHHHKPATSTAVGDIVITYDQSIFTY